MTCKISSKSEEASKAPQVNNSQPENEEDRNSTINARQSARHRQRRHGICHTQNDALNIRSTLLPQSNTNENS